MECDRACVDEILRAAERAGQRYALRGLALAEPAEIASATLEPLVVAARRHDPARGDLGALLRVVADRAAVSYVRSLVGRRHDRLDAVISTETLREDQTDGRAPHAASDSPLPDAAVEAASTTRFARLSLRAACHAETTYLGRERAQAILAGLAEGELKSAIAARLGISPVRLSQILRRLRTRLAHVRGDVFSS